MDVHFAALEWAEHVGTRLAKNDLSQQSIAGRIYYGYGVGSLISGIDAICTADSRAVYRGWLSNLADGRGKDVRWQQ
ncbi:MAG: hypothetical protein NVS4B8_18080 [Herpetosiphon sp.]